MDFNDLATVMGIARAYIENNIPECRERSLALTKLEECMMWTVMANQKHGAENGNAEV